MSSKLIAHELALQAAITIVPLLDSVRAPHRALAHQARRAVASISSNLAEGAGRQGKDRAYHWSIALGSARETHSVLRLMVGIGAVDAAQGHQALGRLDRVQAITWRLVNPR